MSNLDQGLFGRVAKVAFTLLVIHLNSWNQFRYSLMNEIVTTPSQKFNPVHRLSSQFFLLNFFIQI